MSTTNVDWSRPETSEQHGWIIFWFVMSMLVSGLWYAGFRPNADLDDILKLHEIRLLLETGDIFNRTIPGVAQPEPMVSHWPWIVDSPYALVTRVLAVLLPFETALRISTLIVPLLLLGVAVLLLSKIINELAFEQPAAVLFVSVLAATLSMTEFQPGRIDYHNVQMILLLGIVLFSMRPGRRAAFVAAVLVAASMAVSAELAGFLALAMAFPVGRFLVGSDRAKGELSGFGLGLVVGAAGFYLLVVSPSLYGVAACDRYSVVHLAALAGAGAVFVVVANIAALESGIGRAVAVLTGAALVTGVLVIAYPQCLDGPYASVPAYLKERAFGQVQQDGSILAAPEFVGSVLFLMLVPSLVGLGAAFAAGIIARPVNRAWLVYALFAAATLAQAILALRFMRLAPLLSGPGLALVFATLPLALARDFRNRVTRTAPLTALLAPGIAVVFGALVIFAVVPSPPQKIDGVLIASSCSGRPDQTLTWPAGSRVMAAPVTSMEMLGVDNLTVVATPFHTAALGAERVYRFLDAGTPDPRRYLEEAQASIVAVCRHDAARVAPLRQDNQFAISLAVGEPPAWLVECPLGQRSRLRMYRKADSSDNVCPAEMAGGVAPKR